VTKSSRTILIAVLILALIAMGAILLATCGRAKPTPAPGTATLPPTPSAFPPTPAAQDDSWLKVKAAGVLRVGTTADYPPFEYYNASFQLDGFDIALIQQIGQRLGVKVELNDFAFDGLPTTVAIGQVDVAIAALSVTPDRQALADFSNVYYAGSDAVLSRPDADPANVKNTQALAVVRLGVQVNSIYQTYAQQRLIDAGLMPKQNLYVYTNISQAVDDLKAKRIDAVWLDLKPAQNFASSGDIKILVQDLNQQLYAIAMPLGADALRDQVNAALTQLQNDGTLANLEVQYLGLNPDDVVPPQTLPTPVPQPTATPAACLDGATFVANLSYDDKNMTSPPVVNPGQTFTKGWRMRNSGTCTWTAGYNLAYSSGNVPAAQMGGQPIAVTRNVKPGETFDFQVNLVAPVVPGTYQGFWNMRNTRNVKFGQTVWVGITVPNAATPTPKPTQTPVPGISFTANPTTINAGGSTLFKWSTSNVKSVYFYHNGQNWSDHPVSLSGQSTEYPPYSMNYYLRVVQNNNTVTERAILITVNAVPGAPVIENLSATPPQIAIGQCTSIDWSVSGDVTQVTLSVDNNPVWQGAPLKGNYPDCPTSSGTRVYTLQATGPGGTSTRQTSVSVQGPTLTPTTPPDEDTPTPVPPTPTPTPTQPVPQPPVIQSFAVSPTSIEEGQCVQASWSVGGGATRIQLLRDGAVILEDTRLQNSVQDCPSNASPASITYSLVAYNNAGDQDLRDASVQIAPAPPQNPLANTSWQLQSMQGTGDIPGDVSITAYFSADGSLSGTSGCNSYTASYVANGDVITIRPATTTGALCGDPADSLEATYLSLLPQAANFQVDGSQLRILNNTGQEILRYNRTG
jgi:ABC-type amino acid transport substrate-binding protein/heat shock protein HslJ